MSASKVETRLMNMLMVVLMVVLIVGAFIGIITNKNITNLLEKLQVTPADVLYQVNNSAATIDKLSRTVDENTPVISSNSSRVTQLELRVENTEKVLGKMATESSKNQQEMLQAIDKLFALTSELTETKISPEGTEE